MRRPTTRNGGDDLPQAEPFSFVATEIRIGRGRSLQQRLLQAKLFSAASIPKSELEIKNRCTQEGLNREKLASIRKSGLEIKNQCTQKGINRQNPTSIPKFGPEIKNRCTQECINRQNPTLILKSGPEIKNRCSTRLKNRCSTMESALCRGRGMPDGQGLRTA